MKIKELFEEIQNPIIELVYEFNCLTSELQKVARYHNSLEELIAQKAGNDCTCEITRGSHMFEVRLSIPENGLDSIYSYIDDVKSVLREYLDLEQSTKLFEDDIRCEYRFFDKLPLSPHKINFPEIVFITTKSSTLSGIANLIGECDYIQIKKCENIKGSVLGLVKLAKKCQVILASDYNLPKWAEIVNKHLTKPMDILACQDELLENGLKEYAKL